MYCSLPWSVVLIDNILILIHILSIAVFILLDVDDKVCTQLLVVANGVWFIFLMVLVVRVCVMAMLILLILLVLKMGVSVTMTLGFN